jgi:dCMP deaminase
MDGFDALGRPVLDLYVMNMCFDVNWRSFDPSSKHGCIATTPDGSIISTGYNGPVRGSDDAEVPLTRPEKYSFMEHSERNCIYNAARLGHAMEGCYMFITGFPCIECLRAMLQVRAARICYGPYHAAMTNDEDFKRYMQMLKGKKISFERFRYDEALFVHRPDVSAMVEEKRVSGIRDIDLEWIPEI